MNDPSMEKKKCPRCNGYGTIPTVARFCTTCNGTGKIDDDDKWEFEKEDGE